MSDNLPGIAAAGSDTAPGEGHDDSRLATFADVFVLPMSRLLEMDGAYHQGGPLWPDWDTRTFERFNHFGRPCDERPMGGSGSFRKIDGEWWWSGPDIGWAFGHQVGEFSSRIAGTLAVDPNAKFILASWPWRPSVATPVTLDIFAYFGVSPDRLEVVTSPSLVESLGVVPQGEQLWGVGPSLKYSELLRPHYERASGPPGERDVSMTFVSRAGWTRSEWRHKRVGASAYDDYLAELVRHAGGQVLEPEKLSIREQVKALSRSQVTVFADGSAVTTLMLMPVEALERVHVLMRCRTDTQPGFVNLAPRVSSYHVDYVIDGFVSPEAPDAVDDSPFPLQNKSLHYATAESFEGWLERTVPHLLEFWDPQAFVDSSLLFADQWVWAHLQREGGEGPSPRHLLDSLGTMRERLLEGRRTETSMTALLDVELRPTSLGAIVAPPEVVVALRGLGEEREGLLEALRGLGEEREGLLEALRGLGEEREGLLEVLSHLQTSRSWRWTACCRWLSNRTAWLSTNAKAGVDLSSRT